MKNYVLFEVKGLNQERFFNEISKTFKVYDVKRVSKEHCFFKASLFDERKIKKELKKAGFEIISEKHKGVLYHFKKILLSYGLLSGIILGIVLYIIQSLYVRRIEVWGNEKYSDQEIVEFVNVSMNTKLKNRINTKDLENKIFNNFDDLSFVSVAVVGQTVVVNIKEEILPDEMKGGFLPIYSCYDAIIKKIDLIQGTLCVEEGDIIEAGEVLVLPYIINSSGEEMPVKPEANIIAEVWVEGEEIHNAYFEEVYRTGRKIVQNQVYLCGLKLYEKSEENFFSDYEVEEENKPLNKNNLLPFKLKTKTFYEVKKREVAVAFEDVKDELIGKARQKALQNLLEYDIIKNEKAVIRESGNLTTVSYIITLERNIGV